VTPQGVHIPAGDESQRVVAREEKVEYRDENGNILNEEQVAELSGKVSFKTRYETRTRIVDEYGNEVYEGPAEEGDGSEEEQQLQELSYEEYEELKAKGMIEELAAPPHPDVEGSNPETKELNEDQASKRPPNVEASLEGEDKESKQKSARPASDAREATKGEL